MTRTAALMTSILGIVAACGQSGGPPATTVTGDDAATDAGADSASFDASLPSDAADSGCTGTLTPCSAVCVDLLGDGTNCGACGHACASPKTACAAGQCTCPIAECGGGCIDTAVDTANCGACGVQCGGVCASGRCLVTLSSGDYSPMAIAVDGSYVYWGIYGGPIKRVPVTGGTSEVLATGGGPQPSFIFVDATAVYWLHTIYAGIQSVPVAGGPTVNLTGSDSTPYSFTVDATYMYWVDYGGFRKMPLAGGDVYDFQMTGYSTGGPIAVDSSRIYFGAYFGNSYGLYAIPIGGGPPVTKYVDGQSVSHIALSPSRVYWANSNGDICSIHKSGGPILVHATKQFQPRDLKVDATSVYWGTVDGMIAKAPLNGSAVTVLKPKTQLSTPFALAVDETSIYWTEYALGTVMKLTPK